MIVAVISVGTGFFAYNSGVLAGDPQISEAEAKSIAEEHLNGEAKSVKLEKEGISQVYEVIIVNDEGTFEVEIDADSGKILEVEPDDGDEDQDDDKDEHDDDEHDDDEHDDDDHGDDNKDEHDDDEQDNSK